MIFLWAMKNATNGSCIPKVEALASHGEKKKGSTVTHFQKELMVLKGSQFYKHIPSLSVWLVKHFLCLCLSVNADALCQKVFPHKISYFLVEALPAHHRPAFYLHIQSVCIALLVSSSLFGTDWIDIFSLISLPLLLLNNNDFNIRSSVIQPKWKHFSHIGFY